MSRGRRVGGVLAILALAVSAGAAGCATDPDTPGLAALELTWTEVALPDGLTPVTLASSGPDLLVGARASARPAPRLLSGSSPTDLREVPLSPRSPYAFEATWFSVAATGGQVEAVGGARGGAHGNYRWTTWTGTTGGVAEQEQPFGVFGSWGAGDLVGVAFAGDSPVILGAWQSERTGNDIATWLRSGERWNRQSSTGTALGSTPAELLSAGAIASTADPDAGGGDDGLVLSGSVTRLGQGSVRVDPAVWTSPTASGPWLRVDLPRPAGSLPTEAHATWCRAGECLVAGVSGERLALWSLRGSEARTRSVPDVTVAEAGRTLPPLRLAVHVVLVVPGDDRTVLVQSTGEGDEDWTVQQGPRGTPSSAVVHADELLVVTRDASGTGHLWSGSHRGRGR